MATIPTKGRIVHYALSKKDASEISRHRATTRTGRSVQMGTVVPAIVVAVRDDLMKVALHCYLDGPDTFYVPEALLQETPELGDGDPEPGMWFWPPGAPKSR